MNREALTQAIRILYTVPLNNFDMAVYINKRETAGCIAGHCARDPWFISNGFRLVMSETGRLIPAYTNQEGRAAVMLFFQLTSAQTDWLFFDFANYIRTPREAILRIQKTMRDSDEPNDRGTPL